MTNFQQMLQGDAQNVFCNPDEFAEPIEYWSAADLRWTTINAQVFRDPPYAAPNSGSFPAMVIFIASADVPKLNLGGDKIRVKYKPTLAAQEFLITQFEQLDSAMWQLTINKAG